MSKSVDLDAILVHSGDFARKTLIHDGEKSLVSMYVLYGLDPNTVNIVPCLWTDESEKDAVIATVKHIARQVRAVAVSFVTEAWISVQPRKDAFMLTPPSQDPNRKEIVFAFAADKHRTLVRTWQTVRDRPGGTIIALVEDHTYRDADAFSGRMMDGILP